MGDVFSRDALQKYIDGAMGGVPSGHGYARLKVTLEGKVVFTTAARVNDHWMVNGALSYGIKDKAWAGEVEVVASW